jgi:hypothetical protein
MEMPKPGEAHKKLATLVGDWNGTETLYPSPWDPAGGKAKGRTINRGILDGFAVAHEYEQRRGNTVSFRGHGVFWWDEAKQEYVMNWWDTMGGTCSELRGQFAGDVLDLSCPMPDGKGVWRAVWKVPASGRLRFEMQTSPDGQTWAPSMDGEYRRGAGASRKAAKKAAKKKAPKMIARGAKKAPAKAAGRRSAKAKSKAKRR